MTESQASRKRPADLMSVDEAADYLGYVKETLYNKASRNEVPHVKVGKFLRFDPDELDEWIADGCPKVEEAA